ncbi:MAG: hypothetical protein GY815_12990 [Gammaproteobacteria bacterium]|nr:hypothetical protein [Gammaproteobacteria bacterium]
MGMLTYGAMAGVGQEWLKQSAETRQNDFTLIRDKRLSELKKGEQTHASELVGQREKAAHGREKGDYSVNYGEDVYRDGELAASGRDRPTSSSSTAKTGNLITLVTGDQVPYDQLRKSWADQAFTKDEFGNPIRNPDVQGWDEWWNTQVSDAHQRDLPKEAPPPEPEPEEEGPGFFKRLGGWITGDDDEEEPKEGRSTTARTRARGRGMLTESAEPARKPIKLKTPLTRSASRDPVQMYDELNTQLIGHPDISEQDIIDTIRKHFGTPDWQPPADALK